MKRIDNDLIPICVFGNYSSGKSSFINALIGNEVLPSGGDPVTAKIFKITKSEQSDCARIILESDNEAIDFSFEGSVYRIIKGNRDSEIIKKILSAIEECRNNDIFSRVNAALSIINKIERASDMTRNIKRIIDSSDYDTENKGAYKGSLLTRLESLTSQF